MLLVVDIGNTSVDCGVFAGEELRATWRLGTESERLPDEYAILLLGLLRTCNLDQSDIHECVLSSTVPPLTQTFCELIRRYFGATPLVVGSGVRTGLRILYDNPRDVGADRVVNAVAAIRQYGAPLIIVDCGTATVFDAISREGDYVGGAIAPGIGIAAEALFQRASKLYHVELEKPKLAIGKNTAHALQSGIMFGYVGLVEGIVERFQRELGGGARVIGTGAFAAIIAREAPVIDAVNVNLTLCGLKIVHDLNRPPADASPYRAQATAPADRQ
jgi:type III pantothenate kinase